MKRNQKGVTLISLVITIVVMLIIAGAAIATLGGDNGLITRARMSRYSSTEAEVIERMTTGFNTVFAEVSTRTAIEVGHQPSAHKFEYVPLLIEDLGGAGDVNDLTIYQDPESDDYDNNYDPIPNLQDGKYNLFFVGDTLAIVFKDATFALAVPTSATYPDNYPVTTTTEELDYPVDSQYAMLVGQLVFTKSSVSFVEPIKTVMK